MPVKNAGPYLPTCIKSILNQGTSHWELIAVDDHSSDESLSILNDYSSLDHRIKVLSNTSKGIIHALRTAYEFSSGTYITRMDADDYMSDNKVELFTAHLKKSGPGHLAVGLVKYFSDNELGEGYLKYAKWLNELTINQNNFEDIYRECVIPSPNWMMRKVDFESCGAFSSDIYPEDYDLCFRMRRQGLEIIPVKEVTHFWRDHQARSSRNDPNYMDNRFIELKCKYFAEDDYDSSKNLILWGAGKKAKLISRELTKYGLPFRWISNNENKIGKQINNMTIESESILQIIENPQIIISIAAIDAQEHIQKTINSLNCSSYFFS